ncbi:bifunctional class I SAM-dependent methyltransferase/GNAT family N-acetyltransferase [Pseudohongiella spirulinae]|nr:bifunctional class I SAM-dependent methyltransferase/GNAT family N-acetyltransferase [Pseudohongiella spirulinae]
MEIPSQKLPFPLDVYAALLRQTTGCVPFLSYGWLDENDGDDSSALIKAQKRAAGALLKVIDFPAPAAVLEVGCGPGSLCAMLGEAGYRVTAIDNSPAAVTMATETVSQNKQAAVTVVLADFNEYWRQVPAASFDVMVFHCSARYFNPITLMAAAATLLKPGAQLLLLDEFINNPDDIRQPQILAKGQHLLALAERSGFTLTRDEEYSTEVSRFKALALDLLEKNTGELSRQTAYGVETLSTLNQTFAQDLQRCLTGFCSHRLLAWTAPAEARPLLVLAADLPAEMFAEVFERSFNVAFDKALWHWKYGQDRGASVAVIKNNSVVGHYGGSARQILYFGTPELAVQICDVMVLPGERGMFSRKGLFFKMAAAMLEQYAGYCGAHLLGIGFPNLKAMHVAERLGLYEKTDELIQLQISEPDFVRASHVTPEPDVSQAIHTLAPTLWNRMAVGLTDAIVGLRTLDYLNYRYLERPGQNYLCFRIDDADDQCQALALAREHGGEYLVMDLIGEIGMLADAFEALSAYGLQQGLSFKLWITAGQAVHFETERTSRAQLGIEIPCNCWSRGPEAKMLAGAWWLTAGDMDFL